MVRKSLLIVLLSLAPCVAHAEHERPMLDWHHAIGPNDVDGRYPVFGKDGQTWTVDVDLLRLQGDARSTEVTRDGSTSDRTSLAGRAEAVGFDAEKVDMKIWHSKDHDLSFTADASADGYVGADAATDASMVHGKVGAGVSDVNGGAFVGAKAECLVTGRGVICGLQAKVDAGGQGGTGVGGYMSSPLEIDQPRGVYAIRFLPLNAYPGVGGGFTVNVSVDVSAILDAPHEVHDCFSRHFPALTAGVDELIREWQWRESFFTNINHDAQPDGSNVSRFADTTPSHDEATNRDTDNAGFNRGTQWLAR